MSQHLVPYTHPAPLRSPSLLNPPDSVPPTDELEAVQAELKALKQRALERAKKADGDLKAIEVAMKKMREKEKGKGKAKVITKVKREPSCTWLIFSLCIMHTLMLFFGFQLSYIFVSISHFMRSSVISGILW